MERKIAAVCLIAAGVWVQWGAGFGLMTLGVLVGVSAPDVEVSQVARGWWQRVCGLVSVMPRRATAAGLVGASVVALPAGMLLAFGAAGAVLTAGGLMGALGLLVGWET